MDIIINVLSPNDKIKWMLIFHLFEIISTEIV